MATLVVSGRVDETIRHRADAVIRKAGLTPTEIIQNVWNSIAQTGDIPEQALPRRESDDQKSALERLDDFLAALPPANPQFAGLSDDELLAMKTHDHA